MRFLVKEKKQKREINDLKQEFPRKTLTESQNIIRDFQDKYEILIKGSFFLNFFYFDILLF